MNKNKKKLNQLKVGLNSVNWIVIVRNYVNFNFQYCKDQLI